MTFTTTHEIKLSFFLDRVVANKGKKSKQNLEIKEFTWTSQPFKAITLPSGQMIEVVLSSVFRNRQ